MVALGGAAPPARTNPRIEPDGTDSELLTWLLEVGLQPIDRFDSFDYGEQYHGGTCLRYQLNMLGAAMAVANANLLPNYPSLIAKAQENLIEKNTDIRVWRYWYVENILGNFDRNPDPIVRDNIMFSGFLANQLSEFEAATGSARFDAPGSLRFVWRDGRVFSYDHHSIAEVVARNFSTADLGMFPCEPGWVFSACNVMAAQGLKGYDTAHGTRLFADVQGSWRSGLFNEMMTPDGNIRHLRSTILGLSFNDGDGTGEYLTTGTHLLADVAPDMALRGSVLQLRGVPEKLAGLHGLIKDGELELSVTPKRERGTRYLSRLGEWFGLVAGARAIGDEELVQAAQRGLHRQCGTAEAFPGRPLEGGVMTIAMYLSTRWGSPLSISDLVVRGWLPPSGPILEDAPWPALLVSKARCDDGRSLDLVLEPYQTPAGGSHDLTFRVEETTATHRLVGPGIDLVLSPDAEGRITVSIPVESRISLNLGPH